MTQATVPNPATVTKLTLIEKHFEGVKMLVSKLFGIEAPPVVLSNSPLQAILLRANNRPDIKTSIKYPLTYLTPRSVSVNNDRLNPARMAKSRYTRLFGTNPDGTWQGSRFVPAQINVEFGYITDDMNAYLKMASTWVFAAKSGRLNFAILHNGVRVDIQVELSDSIDIPEKDEAAEVINQASGVGTITINGYVDAPLNEPEIFQPATPMTSFTVE